MSEKPEALADRLDDERMNLIERLADENERLREALTYDWDQLEACRESLREHMVEIKRLREALALAERLAAGRLAMVEQLTDEVGALRRERT